MDAESLPEKAGVPFPFYVRKLDKKSVWGHSSDEVESRKFSAAQAVFNPKKLRFSLYLVRSWNDLVRVTVALNAGRNRLNDQVDFIAFGANDISTASINILPEIPGETDCAAANKLHVDIEASEYSKFQAICSSTIDKNREAFRVTKKAAKKMVIALKDFGCLAFPENNQGSCECQVEDD